MSDEPKEEPKEDFKSKWDSEKQRADQEHANYEKEKAERERVIAEKEAIAEQYTATQAKIAELEAKIQSQSDTNTYPELDPISVDGNVIKSIQQLKSERLADKKELAELKSLATKFQASEQQRLADAQQEMMVNKACKPLDDEFGAKHRNAAQKLAEKLVSEGKEKKPEDPIDAVYLLRKCYIQVSEAAKPKDQVRTDTGGGSTASPPSSRKTGTLAEVKADMLKDTSWKDAQEVEMLI